jgi:hypothetical protein
MGRKARLKRERRSGANLSEAGRTLRRRLASVGLPMTFREGPTADRKLSDALLEFVQPILDALPETERTKPRLEQILLLGALAWNAHLMPDSAAFVERALTDLVVEGHDVAQPVVEILLERRRELFADDPRFVVDTFVTRSASGKLQVSAAHAPLIART